MSGIEPAGASGGHAYVAPLASSTPMKRTTLLTFTRTPPSRRPPMPSPPRTSCLRAIGAGAIAVLLTGCASAAPGSGSAALWIEEHAEWRDVFTGAGTRGVFALHRVGAPTILVSDSGRAARSYLPASTFKVPNSLIALEMGIVQDERHWFPMTWEPTEIEAWNRDHTFESALRHSVVPIYQIVARAVGEDRYEDWLARLVYGNEDPGGGIDHFWLDGDLRTSALDQIDFLSRLSTGSLPLSRRSQDIVRRMLLQEDAACYALFGKTGLVGVAARREIAPEDRVGWFVGWVERDTATWAFALNLDVRRSEDAQARVPLAKELLERSGVIPADGCPGT